VYVHVTALWRKLLYSFSLKARSGPFQIRCSYVIVHFIMFFHVTCRGEDGERDRLESVRSNDGALDVLGDDSSTNTSPARTATSLVQRERSLSANSTSAAEGGASGTGVSARPRNASDDLTGASNSPVAFRRNAAAQNARRASPTVISVTADHTRKTSRESLGASAGGSPGRAGKSSKESLSMEDSGNQSPDTATTNRLSSLTDCRSDFLLDSGGTTTTEIVSAPPSNTHIIRVSGPVTNLDETVVSAEGVVGTPVTTTTDQEVAASVTSASSTQTTV
jgi:hypothetical protein